MLLQGAEQEQDRGADEAEQKVGSQMFKEGQEGDVALSEYLSYQETIEHSLDSFLVMSYENKEFFI